MSATVEESDLTLNLVWTGRVFDDLQLYTESMLDRCSARFRFVANACPPDQLQAMEAFAEAHPGRVVEVLDVSSKVMVRHGDALDVVLDRRDDGEHFCFVDPDIFAMGPYLRPFCQELTSCAAVTSGRELWSDHNVRPATHIGVNGEYFFDQDGYVFGSPHVAFYRRRALDETRERWGVGLSSAGNDISGAARHRLEAVGRSFWVYDTAKIVNILLQADGHELRHLESPDLIHIGGVSHYLTSHAPDTVEGASGPSKWGLNDPNWGKQDGMAARYLVAGYTAAVLQALAAGGPVPEVPEEADDALLDRLALVRSASIDLVARYGSAGRRGSVVAEGGP